MRIELAEVTANRSDLPRAGSTAVAAVLAAVVAALLWVGVATRTLLAAGDPQVDASIAATRPPALEATAAAISTTGQPAVMIAVLGVVAALVPWRSRSWGPALVGEGALVVLGVLDNGVKTVVARPRPPVAWQAVTAHGLSFPSGHALWSAGALLLVVVLVGPVRGRMLVILAALLVLLAVGGSRLVLAVHCPSAASAGVLRTTAAGSERTTRCTWARRRRRSWSRPARGHRVLAEPLSTRGGSPSTVMVDSIGPQPLAAARVADAELEDRSRVDAGAVVTAIAAGISLVFSLLSFILGRRQVDAAQRQVEAAQHQVETAREQADAARQQVDAARQQVDAARQQVDAARQQVEVAQHEVDSGTLIDLMNTFREPRFHRRYQYVVNLLQSDYPPEHAVPLFDIPGEPGEAAVEIAYFFQNCAAFADYGLVSEDKIVTFLHLRFRDVWEAVAPYVNAERERKGFTMLSSLEVYAEYVVTLDEHDVHAKLVRSASHFPAKQSS